MNTPELILAVSEAKPDCKRFRFVCRTKPALTKKNRATREPTTFEVEKTSTFTAALGVDYEKEVNDLLESEGHARDFAAKPPSGKHYVDGSNWLLESDKTPGKFYVAVSRIEDASSVYTIDGVEATPEQVEDLKANYLPKSSSSGLVAWFTYSADSIVSVEPVA